jgi:glycosyltransferase involved in cell wall biosynthesis
VGSTFGTPPSGVALQSESDRLTKETGRPIKVFMMDLLAIVPYYDAYLCRALQQQGLLVTLASITYYLDPNCFSERRVRNRPGVLDLVAKLGLPRILRRPLKLCEAMLNLLATSVRVLIERPDVVHVQFLPLLRWRLPVEDCFLLYSRYLGIKVVYTVHDLVPHDTGDRHQKRFARLYRMMDALVCHSEVAKQQLVAHFGIPSDRVWVIPHGPFFHDCSDTFDPRIRAKYQTRPGECLVLWHGLIFPYKGVEFLLDSWAKVQKAGMKARLVIAGTGGSELLGAIRSRAEALGISDSVTFDFRFLPVEELTSLIRASDIVVYPYKKVTTSGALHTGMALGRAIIATNLAPFAEILEHEKSALLVTYGNAEELAAAIIRLVNEPETRQRLGAEVTKLGSGDEAWQKIAKKTVECYASLLREEVR